MKVQPIDRNNFTNSRNSRDYHDPAKLIYIIDEMIVGAPDIPNSYRFVTSTGMIQVTKCQTLLDFLERKSDDRSLRIKNLLRRLIRLQKRG